MVNPTRLRPFQDIAERLRVVREAQDLDQRQFAARAGLKYSQYKNWESGAFRLSLDGALALRRVYGVTLEFLYVGDIDSLPISWRKELSSKLRDNS